MGLARADLGATPSPARAIPKWLNCINTYIEPQRESQMPYKDLEKQKTAQRESYLRNKEEIKKRQPDISQKFRKNRIEWYNSILATKTCIYCNESCTACLEWHHLDPSQKWKEVSTLFYSHYTKELILEEMSKCIVLCSNCHKKLHAGLIDIDKR